MNNDKTYNGWPNYETWSCALWLDNDEGLYNEVRDRVKEIVEDNAGCNKDDIICYVKDWLGDFVDGVFFPESPGGLAGDLLNAARGQINMWEIAKNYVDEITAEIAEEEKEDNE